MSKVVRKEDIDDDTLVFSVHDAVYFNVECSDDGMIKWLAKKYTFRISNWRYHPKVQAGIWDGKLSLLDTQRNLLPMSLFESVIKDIRNAGYKYYVDFDKSLMHDFDITYDKVLEFTRDIMKNAPFEWEDRDYQMRCIYSCLKQKRGVIEASVGAGKSFIIYAVIRYLLHHNSDDFKIILTVPTIMLVQQMVQDWADYGWDEVEEVVEILHGKVNPSFQTQVLVTTWQSVYKRKQRFFESYDCLIFDEAHTASSESLLGIAKKCVNAEYRIGTTGTMPEEKMDEMNIIAFIGPIRESVKTKELQEKGVLTRLRVLMVELIYDKRIYQIAKGFNYQGEIKFISEYPERYKKIVGVHRKYVKHDENTLILAQKHDQIDNLVEHFKQVYGESRPILVISGKVGDKEREKIRKSINNLEGAILIATYQTMSTGVNIPRLHHIFLASPYKSKIKVIQSLGRVLRKHKSKTIAYLWDFVDDLTGGFKKKNYSMKHRDERLKMYKKEGFPMKTMKITMGNAVKKITKPTKKSVWIKK